MYSIWIKLFAFVILFFASEILLVWYLHDFFSILNVVLLYVILTAISMLWVLLMRKITLPDREVKRKRLRTLKRKVNQQMALTPSEMA